MRPLGVHTSIANGVHLSIERAHKLGCTALQIFSHSPRTWVRGPIDSREAGEFRRLRRRYGYEHIFIHSSYLINLCSPDRTTRERSIEMLLYELKVADKLGVQYVVLHPGRASGQSATEAMEKLRRSLRIIEQRWDGGAGILLENTAGQRGDISSRIAQLAEIADSVTGGLIRGLCLDSAHAFQAGYNIATPQGLESLEEEMKRYMPGYRIRLIHLNDSKAGFNSGLDRHEHIGRGGIGIEGFRVFLSYPLFRDIPLILETPKKSEDDDRRNLLTVRRILETVEQSMR